MGLFMGLPPCEHALADLTFFEMDGYNLHTIRKLVVGNHHLSTTAMLDHGHHSVLSPHDKYVLASPQEFVLLANEV